MENTSNLQIQLLFKLNICFANVHEGLSSRPRAQFACLQGLSVRPIRPYP